MDCLSGTHPAKKEGEGKGLQVEKKEDFESVQTRRSSFPTLRTL